MTEHVSIQDPADFSEQDMTALAEQLFSPLTPTEELARICMLLAHVPTEGAQDLLRRFRESTRAAEVSWLEVAAEEGTFHLMQPRNELEERELLTLRLIEEIEDGVVDLNVRREELRHQCEKLEIRHAAIRALVAADRLDSGAAVGIDDALLLLEKDIAELDIQVEVEQAVAAYLHDSITTPRYRNADPNLIRHIHYA